MVDRIATLEDPRSIGEALHGPDLKKYWKYRVGDYRVIVKIEDERVSIVVIRIGNRREVYR
jgi:mRNA interferase RelE/StbE